jgi:uncharacterized surface protein with fasciclin (FAS1) repeats
MKKLKSLSQTFLIASAVALFGSSSAARNLVDTAAGLAEFSTLTRLIKAAGLDEEWKRAGPFTVFAPTDAAFAKLPAGQLDRLAGDRDALRQMLSMHVVPGVLITSEFRPGAFNTAAGHAQEVNVGGDGRVRFGLAAVVSADVEASNGVLHAIDSVILPA